LRIFASKQDELTRDSDKYIKRSLKLLLNKYYSGDQMKKEVDGACNTYGRVERFIQSVGGES